jgi:G:T-mismatch repair DNA endonuclease (very short patch repair protein)
MKEKWKDKDYVSKVKKMINIKPNKSEDILIKIFEKLELDFKYVGDFSVMIDGKNPDFINEDKKLIIELFGDYWHGEKHRREIYNDFSSNEEHEIQRINHFKKDGWKCLVIWEEELKNIDKLQEKILKFDSV